MTPVVITETSITSDCMSYPFNPPEGFNEWLSIKKEAFAMGIVYTLAGHNYKPQHPHEVQPTQEQLL